MTDQLALTRDVGRTRDLDRHFTPDACARLLVSWLVNEYFGGECAAPWARPGLVIEPSVGGGAFARAVRPHLAEGGRVVGYDVDPAAEGRADVDEWRCRSWLDSPDHETAGVDLIVGNPWAPLGGVAAWDDVMDGAERPVVAVPIVPRPWPSSVRETAMYVWLPLEPTPRRTEVVRIGRWR